MWQFRPYPKRQQRQTQRRLAFGITDLDIGGAERMLVELVLGLRQRGWQPAVVCLQPEGPLADRLRAGGVPVASLQLRHGSQLIRAGYRWWAWLRRYRPLLLQTFLFHANILGRLVGRLAGVPVVLAGVRVAERRFRWHGWADRATHWLCRQHICVSHAVAQFTHQQIRIPRSRLCVIPNGVPHALCHQATPQADELPAWLTGLHPQQRLQTGQRLLFVVGRLDPQKGVLDVVQAVRELRQQSPALASQLRLCFVGDGPMRQELLRRIHDWQLADLLTCVGWQPEPWRWYGVADALLLASRWEGMPNVVLEALATGLPVIATAVEGTTELIQSGRTGLLVPPADPVALAAALRQFLLEPEAFAQMGCAGRRLVAEQFTIDQMVDRYEALYRHLLRMPPIPQGTMSD